MNIRFLSYMRMCVYVYTYKYDCDLRLHGLLSRSRHMMLPQLPGRLRSCERDASRRRRLSVSNLKYSPAHLNSIRSATISLSGLSVMAVTPTVASVALSYALPVGIVTTPLLAYTALSPTPSFGPLILLLSLWQLNTAIILPRKQFGYASLQTLLIAFAVGFSHAGPALGALSTPSISVLIMSCFSLITTIVAQLTIVATYYASCVTPSPWARVTLFPALWATVWGGLAEISPVGRLITWSPVVGLGPYQWIRPVFGQWGVDWIVAAWAVALTDLAGNLIMGQPDGSDEPTAPPRGNLVSVDDDNAGGEEPRSGGVVPQCLNSSSSWRVVWLTALLVGLSVPSALSPSLPNSLISPNTTPLGLACVLPDTSRSGHYGGPPTLDDYIKASSTLQSSAEVILWPEGAVRFDNAKQKEEAFEKIMKKMAGQKYWGISFEEHVLSDSPDGQWRAGMRRNGLAVLTRNGSVFEYFKRNLVPGTHIPVHFDLHESDV